MRIFRSYCARFFFLKSNVRLLLPDKKLPRLPLAKGRTPSPSIKKEDFPAPWKWTFTSKPFHCAETPIPYTKLGQVVAHSHLILVVDDTIAIDILILDVARHIIAKSLFGAITDVIVILEQAQCNKSLSLVNTVATLPILRINVLLFIFFLHFVL